MNIKGYFNYFKYILEHKKNVLKVCWQKKMYLHSITHDISKFLPDEFFPYARYFYNDDKTISDKKNFEKAWMKHYKRNKHHWNYWAYRNIEMPKKYMKQMICDWEAMSIKFGDTPLDFYNKNKDKIILIGDSRKKLEILLLSYINKEGENRNGMDRKRI